MKNLLFLIFICCGLNSFAQFVVTGGSITLQPSSMLTVGDLIIQPGAPGVSFSNNAIMNTPVAETVNSGNSINSVYYFTNPLVYTGALTLKYRDADLNGNAPTDLQMVYSASNTPVTYITTTGSVVNTTTKEIQQSFAGTTISRITASSNTIPLAIQLLTFDAKKVAEGRAAILSWSVAHVAEIKSFVVERSADGKDFVALGTVLPNADPNYSTRDEQPLKGWNFYRLKMIDIADAVSYSVIKPLQFDEANSVVSVFPNPVISQVTIHTTDAELMSTEAIVIDINGRVIKHFVLQSESTVVSAEGWPSGSYIIKLQNGQTFKVVKK